MKVNIEAYRSYQMCMAEQVSLVNAVSSLAEIEIVAAADISCSRFSTTGYAAVMVFTYPGLQLIDQLSYTGELTVPYIPGYLAFREAPLIQLCLYKIEYRPQVLICDGQGIAHPRRCGIASYLGVLNNMITVGCGKSRLIGEFVEPEQEKGCRSDLMDQGEKIGEVVRTRDNTNPLFISPGHKIDFDLSTQLILSLCDKYRQPEPIRAVHKLVNEIRVKSVIL